MRDVVQIGCLSNTNSFQWDTHFEGAPIVEAFEFRFLSFELGMVKPDHEIFEEVAARLPVAPEQVLFLDDNAANVAGAERSGSRPATCAASTRPA